MKEQFRIKKVVFVGDKGIYSQAAIENIQKAGSDYILSLKWRKQRKQLEDLAPDQLGLFDQMRIVEWEEGRD